MSTSSFRFQQFEVWHDRCAMKVGTDGVLLGAWVNVESVQCVLDVGVGSGLISLMIAQRNTQAEIHGIDVDAEAVSQAQENFQRSPFSSRLSAEVADFTSQFSLLNSQLFDLIVCNPPFFTEDTQAPDAARAAARSNSSLPFDVLIERAARLLHEQGHFAVIIPYAQAADFVLTASTFGLYLQRRSDVKTTPQKSPKRSLLEFGKQTGATQFDTLCLHDSDVRLSKQYQALTADFYLPR